MFASPAYAQAVGGAAPQGDIASFLTGPIGSILPLVALVVLFYFLMIRPQQRRIKDHQATLSSLKRGDTVILNSGVHGKIVRVEDATVGVEIATGVTVKVRKSMIAEVETRGAPAPANDSKT